MYQGSIVALVTPMGADAQVDYAALATLVQWHVEQGTAGIVVAGTTGESATLTDDERLKLYEVALKAADGQVPIIAGTGANCTEKAVTLSQSAKAAGVQACLLVTPYYNKPQQEGLYLHYARIAEAVAMDHILYNVPSRTACDLLPETVVRLAQIPNIVGIKEATGDLDRLADIKAEVPSTFALYSGDDASAVEFILAGGHGTISVTANIVPHLVAQLCKEALAGHAEAARAINEKIQILNRRLFIESNPIPVKWALAELLRIPSGTLRLPLTPLTSGHQESVREALKQVGVA